MDQLRGSRKDVFEKLHDIIQAGEQPSIMAIAHCTGWSMPTVQRALSDLREWGYIHYDQEIPGKEEVTGSSPVPPICLSDYEVGHWPYIQVRRRCFCTAASLFAGGITF